ncbi:MAG: hypothetical protein JEY91_00955 [Spirochaetaceae bacterium]|nr:hypothetical protein [Spirochaetaceae bacterium]
MKRIVKLFRKIGSFPIVILFICFLGACSRDDADLLERMSQMEGDGSVSYNLENDKNYNTLRKDIEKYRKILDEKIDAAEKLGTYYKLIGLKYLDYSMYALALEAFEEALAIYPENPNVLYNAGLASARLSKTEVSEGRSRELLIQAERYYKASLSVNDRFSSPMYGLAILYVYELDQPELAIPLMEVYNTIQKSSMNGRFLLAAAYYASGNEGEAVDIYDEIINTSESDTEIESARANRNAILRGEGNE